MTPQPVMAKQETQAELILKVIALRQAGLDVPVRMIDALVTAYNEVQQQLAFEIRDEA